MIYEQIESACLEFHRRDNKDGNMPYVCFDCVDKACDLTAKQIFKELDEAVWEQIEPSRLEEFYEQFSNAKDLKASLNVAIAFSIIGLDAERYEAIKKKYNIEE